MAYIEDEDMDYSDDPWKGVNIFSSPVTSGVSFTNPTLLSSVVIRVVNSTVTSGSMEPIVSNTMSIYPPKETVEASLLPLAVRTLDPLLGGNPYMLFPAPIEANIGFNLQT